MRAVFVPLAVLQRALGLEGRVNILLASASEPRDAPGDGSLATRSATALSLDDLGLRLRILPAAGALQLETAERRSWTTTSPRRRPTSPGARACG